MRKEIVKYILLTIAILTTTVNAQDFWEYSALNGTSIGFITEGPDGRLYAAGTEYAMDSIFTSVDNGETWQLYSIVGDSLFTNISAMVFKGNDTIFVSTWGYGSDSTQGVYRSTDRGLTWEYKSDFDLEEDESPDSWGVDISPVDGSLYTITNYDIYKSTDFGESWTSSNIPCCIVGADLVVDSEGTVFAVGWHELLRSKNNGITWDTLNTGRNVTYNEMTIASDGTMYVATESHGIFISMDKGDTWELVDQYGGMTDISSNSKYIIAAPYLYGDMFLSRDNGETWNDISSGLPSGYVLSVYINDDGYAFCSFQLKGIYKTTSPVTGVDEENPAQITSYKLNQNYPNPFNPATKITYQLPARAFVTLKIYDILGNEIAALVNSEQVQGEYEVEFNAAGLSSGVYFYELTAGNHHSVKKLILMR